MQYLIILLIFLLSWTEVLAGGPWTKEKGEGYAQFALYAIPSTNRFSINAYRTKFLNRAIFDATAELYAEYGLLKRLTLSASLPLKIVMAGEKVFSTDSTMLADGSIGTPGKLLDAGVLVDLGNVSIAGKYNFYSKKIYLSAHLLVAAPTAIQAYNPNTALRTAYPCWTFQPSLSLGYSSAKIYTYFETGMSFRTHDYSHQWMANFELGWKISAKVYLAIAINAYLALPGGADIPNTKEEVQTGLYVNNQNFVAITFKVLIPVTERVGVNLSLSGGVWANNIQQGPNVGLGVYYQWKKKELPRHSE